jgi:hypothetical protein
MWSSQDRCGFRAMARRSGTLLRRRLQIAEIFRPTREFNMKDAHNQAAEHHESAAKSHRAAAAAHGSNDHAKGKEHSTQAQQHAQNANEHSKTAQAKSAQQK